MQAAAGHQVGVFLAQLGDCGAVVVRGLFRHLISRGFFLLRHAVSGCGCGAGLHLFCSGLLGGGQGVHGWLGAGGGAGHAGKSFARSLRTGFDSHKGCCRPPAQLFARRHRGIGRQADFARHLLVLRGHIAKSDLRKRVVQQGHARLDVAGHTGKGFAHLVHGSHHSVGASRHHAIRCLGGIAGNAGVFANAFEGFARLRRKGLQVGHHLFEINLVKKVARPFDGGAESLGKGLAEFGDRAVVDQLAQRCNELVHTVLEHRQNGRAQLGLDGVPDAAQTGHGAGQVVAHHLCRGCCAAAGIVQPALEVAQRHSALIEQRLERRAGFQPHCVDGFRSASTRRGQLRERVREVGSRDAQRAQFAPELAGRVGKLAHDRVERGACAAGVNAGIGKFANDCHRGFQRQAQRLRGGRGIRQGFRQAFDAGVGGVGTQCQYIGHAARVRELQAHAHDGFGHVLCRRAQGNVARFCQGQHRWQSLNGLGGGQAGLGQIFQRPGSFHPRELGGGTCVFRRLLECVEFFIGAAGCRLDPAHGRFKF